MTPTGIETAICRFVAWCLNPYATARPTRRNRIGNYFKVSSYLPEVGEKINEILLSEKPISGPIFEPGNF
jgi:hypothetical protein